MKAKHNDLIKEFIKDPNFMVNKNGEIYKRCKTQWRKCKTTTHNGYARVHYRGSKLRVHRIVFAAYGKGRLELVRNINHKDGNKLNNSVDNLEQVTHLENIRHSISMGLRRKRKTLKESKESNKNTPSLAQLLKENNFNIQSLNIYGLASAQGEARLVS